VFAIAPLVGGFQGVDTIVSVGTTPTLIVRPDNRRALLYITNPTTVNLNLWHNPAIPDVNTPGIIVPTQTTRRMAWADDGPLPTWGWLAAAASGTISVIVLQVLWLPEQLAQSHGVV
jgi:hypothetical protein